MRLVKPKLSMLQKIIDLEEWSDCARLRRRSDRRMMIKLRGGTAAFQIETGRWQGVAREERVCKECGSGEVEDVEHWLLRCAAWKTIREQFTSPSMVKIRKILKIMVAIEKVETMITVDRE